MKSRISTLTWNTSRSQLVWIILVSLSFQLCLSAPAQEEEEQGGCYYMFNHYGEGDRILTNEPCLNCTCHNSMLMCYLSVCPFTKPIGQDCTIEKKADQCCPVITCPEVPVSLLSSVQPISSTSTTTQNSLVVGSLQSERGCELGDRYYSDGAQVDLDSKNPCELCYCIRNRTACVMQECILHVEGCEPEFEYGVCCPVRYKCQIPIGIETTTIAGFVASTISSLLTSTSTPHPGGCYRDGEFYYDGSQIPTPGEAPCEHCYCMRGEIVCAVQECGSPLEGAGQNCTAIPPRTGLCCPEQYSCHPSSRQDRKYFLNFNESSQSNPSLQVSNIISAVDNSSSEPPPVQTRVTGIPAGLPHEITTTNTTYEEDFTTNPSDKVSEGYTQLPVKGIAEQAVPSTERTTSRFTPGSATVEPVTSQADETGAESSTNSLAENLQESSTTRLGKPIPSVESGLPSQTESSIDLPSTDNAGLPGVDATPPGDTSETELHVKDNVRVTSPVSSPSPSEPTGIAVEVTTRPTLLINSTEPPAAVTPSGVDDLTTPPNEVSTEAIPEALDNKSSTSSYEENELFTPEAEHASKRNMTVGDEQVQESKTEATPTKELESGLETSSSDSTRTTIEAFTQGSVSPEIPSVQSEQGSATESPVHVKEVESTFTTQPIALPNEDAESTGSITTSYTETPTGTVNYQPEQIETSSEGGVGIESLQNKTLDQHSDDNDNEVSPGVDQITQSSLTTPVHLLPGAPAQGSIGGQIDQTLFPSLDDDKYHPGSTESNFIEGPSKSTGVPEPSQESSQSIELTTTSGRTTEAIAEIISTTESLKQDVEQVPVRISGIPNRIEPGPSRVPETSSISQDLGLEENTESSKSPSVPLPTLSAASESSIEETSSGVMGTEIPIANTVMNIFESSVGPEIIENSTKPYIEALVTSLDQESGNHSSATLKPTEAPIIQDLEVSKSPTVMITAESSPTIEPPVQSISEASTPEVPHILHDSDEEYPTTISTGSLHVSASTALPGESPGLSGNVVQTTEFASHEFGEITSSEGSIQEGIKESQGEAELPLHDNNEALGTGKPDLQVTPEPSTEKIVSETPTDAPDAAKEGTVKIAAGVSGVPAKTPIPESTEAVTGSGDQNPLYTTESPNAGLEGSTEIGTQSPQGISETPGPILKESVMPVQEADAKEFNGTEEINNNVIHGITTEKEISQATTEAYKATNLPVSGVVDTTESQSFENATEYSKPSPITQLASESSSVPELQGAGTEVPTSIVEAESPHSTTQREQVHTDTTETSKQSVRNITGSGIGDLEGPNVTVNLEFTTPAGNYSQSTPEQQEAHTTEAILSDKSSDDTESTGLHFGHDAPGSMMSPMNLIMGASSVSSTQEQSIPESTTPVTVPGADTSSTVGISQEVKDEEKGSTPLTQDFSRIPGEGSCFVDGVTYPNGSRIPPSTSCQIACACQNSIVHCLLVHCPAAPRGFGDCKPIYTQNKCCPKYNCDDTLDNSITVTPEPAQAISSSPDTIIMAEVTLAPTEDRSGSTTVVAKTNISGIEQGNQVPTLSAESQVHTSTEAIITTKPTHDSSHDVEASVSGTTPVLQESSNGTTEPNKGESVPTPLVPASSESTVNLSSSTTERPPKDNSTLKYPVTFTPSSITSAQVSQQSTSTSSPSSASNGACLFDSRVYMSAQQIPRDDPCDFCFCFRGDIICLQQSCPPPIPGCYEEPIPGFCCPRYECPVGSGNTTSVTLLPPSYYHNQVANNAVQPSSAPSGLGGSGTGCEIQGEYYEAGQLVTATSGPCLECRCGQGGNYGM